MRAPSRTATMSTISTQSSSWLQSEDNRTAETGGPIGMQGPYTWRAWPRPRQIVWRRSVLSFQVFNLELNEGLDTSRSTGYDIDRFDAVCDQPKLIVEHAGSGQVVGTYRLQSGMMASANFGYYSEREFDLTPYGELRDSMIELGRACVHRDHRSADVLNLLWRGIARYAMHSKRASDLIGCSSLTSQDPASWQQPFYRTSTANTSSSRVCELPPTS